MNALKFVAIGIIFLQISTMNGTSLEDLPQEMQNHIISFSLRESLQDFEQRMNREQDKKLEDSTHYYMLTDNDTHTLSFCKKAPGKEPLLLWAKNKAAIANENEEGIWWFHSPKKHTLLVVEKYPVLNKIFISCYSIQNETLLLLDYDITSLVPDKKRNYHVTYAAVSDLGTQVAFLFSDLDFRYSDLTLLDIEKGHITRDTAVALDAQLSERPLWDLRDVRLDFSLCNTYIGIRYYCNEKGSERNPYNRYATPATPHFVICERNDQTVLENEWKRLCLSKKLLPPI